MKKPLMLGIAALLLMGAGVGLFANYSSQQKAEEVAANKVPSVEKIEGECQKDPKVTDVYSCRQGYQIVGYDIKKASDYNGLLAKCSDGRQVNVPSCSAGAYLAFQNFNASPSTTTSSKTSTSQSSQNTSTSKATQNAAANKSARDSNSASAPGDGSSGNAKKASETDSTGDEDLAGDCEEGVEVSSALNSNNNTSDNCIGGNGTNPIFALLASIIQYMTAAVGIIMVLMIVIAGLQYVLAASSPDTAKDARNRIERAFTGLVLFILMFGILQILLPPDVKVFR